MTDNVYTLLAQCIQGKGSEDFVFTRRTGKRIADFRGTWHKVCCTANLGVMYCPTCDKPVPENLCRNCGDL